MNEGIGWRTENAVTVVSSAALVAGLFWMSGSFWSCIGFLLLLNLNGTKS